MSTPLNTTVMYHNYPCIGTTGIKADQVRLMEDLFKNYDANARPVKNSSEVVTVGIELNYNQVKDLVSFNRT